MFFFGQRLDSMFDLSHFAELKINSFHTRCHHHRINNKIFFTGINFLLVSTCISHGRHAWACNLESIRSEKKT